ncbi:MAG: diguanylate cyclase, partial [Pseudomonadota bacterium]
MGLAARGVAFVSGLMLLAAGLAAVTVWYGASDESERHQFDVATDLAKRFASSMADRFAQNDMGYISGEIPRLASRDDVVRVGLRTTTGAVIAEQGRGVSDASLAEQLTQKVLTTGAVAHGRSTTGVIGVAAPMVSGGRKLGVAFVLWAPNQFRFDTLRALTPFFIALVCFMAFALALVVLTVRRVLKPLETLTRFADSVQQGDALPLVLKTNDEFEVLADAFNQMIARLQASMRKIQQMAFVDPVTQLPNQERFQRELNYAILQAEQAGATGLVLVFEFQRLPRLMQTLDPEAARELTRAVAERFMSALRATDRYIRLNRATEKPATGARLGATDFAALVPSVQNPQEAARVAQQLHSALGQAFDW